MSKTKYRKEDQRVELIDNITRGLGEEVAYERITKAYEEKMYNELLTLLANKNELTTLKKMELKALMEEIDKRNPFHSDIQSPDLFHYDSSTSRKSLTQLYMEWVAPMRTWAHNKTGSKVEIISWLAGMMCDYVWNNYDFMIGISGEEGTTKSSFSLGLARALKKKGMNFNIIKNMFFTSTPIEYIISRIENSEREVFIFDEGQSQFDSRNFGTKEQKDLLQAIVNSRRRGHIYIINTPDVNAIDVRLRDRRLRMIINLLDSNVGIILFRHSSGMIADAFGLKELQARFKKIGMWTVENLCDSAIKVNNVYTVFNQDGYTIPLEHFEFYEKLKMTMNKVSGRNSVYVSTFTRNLILDVLNIVLKNEDLRLSVLNSLKEIYHLPKEMIEIQIRRLIAPYMTRMKKVEKLQKKAQIIDDRIDKKMPEAEVAIETEEIEDLKD